MQVKRDIFHGGLTALMSPSFMSATREGVVMDLGEKRGGLPRVFLDWEINLMDYPEKLLPFFPSPM